jgi:hypothetical protein
MFSWFARQVPTVIPPPPQQPSKITAQNMDIVALLNRIDSKLDILLTKMDGSGTQRKKFPTVTTQEISSETKEGGHGGNVDVTTRGVPNFTNELFQRIEQLKHVKHMGESHGFF